MTAFAREPLVAPYPSGAQEQDGSSPPSAPLIPEDIAARAANEPAHTRRPFLHILAGNATGAAQTVPVDQASPMPATPQFRVDLLDRPAVSGTMLTSDPREPATPYLSEISFEGMSFAIPKTRNLQVPGNFGMLSVSANGAFSYTRAEFSRDFVDVFVCTARGPDDAPPVRITLEILSSAQDELRSLAG